MASTEEDHQNIEIGCRVHVMSADMKKDLGFGTYMGLVSMDDIPDKPLPAHLASDTPIKLTDEERAVAEAIIEHLSKTGFPLTPKFILDSDEIIHGFQCWWERVEEARSSH